MTDVQPAASTEPRTLWHSALCQMVIDRAPPVAQILADQPLGLQPMRADLLIISLPPPERRNDEARILHGLWRHLPERTILEFKSLQRALAAGGLARLQCYGDRHFSDETDLLHRPSQLALVLLVVSITPTLRRELERMSWGMTALGDGYYRMTGSFFPTYVAVIDEISDAEHDALLDSVGRGRMIDGTVSAWWCEHMAHTPEAIRLMNTKQPTEEMIELMRRLPPEMRARVMDRSAIRLLSPEALSTLTPEQQASVLSSLTLEQQFSVMPVEVLRGLSDAYVASLPANVRAEIERRLTTH